ncbi:hypothetical protein [Robbsia sp. KACC 23696]|uniref:hypothetical protein n=1 Tax=Robbsia sp. KACC 23696 TaxID=3149231 RepID=UPI00325AB4EF
MSTYATVKDGIVTNLILIEADSVVVVPDPTKVNIGDSYADGVFTPAKTEENETTAGATDSGTTSTATETDSAATGTTAAESGTDPTTTPADTTK